MVFCEKNKNLDHDIIKAYLTKCCACYQVLRESKITPQPSSMAIRQQITQRPPLDDFIDLTDESNQESEMHIRSGFINAMEQSQEARSLSLRQHGRNKMVEMNLAVQFWEAFVSILPETKFDYPKLTKAPVLCRKTSFHFEQDEAYEYDSHQDLLDDIVKHALLSNDPYCKRTWILCIHIQERSNPYITFTGAEVAEKKSWREFKKSLGLKEKNKSYTFLFVSYTLDTDISNTDTITPKRRQRKAKAIEIKIEEDNPENSTQSQSNATNILPIDPLETFENYIPTPFRETDILFDENTIELPQQQSHSIRNGEIDAEQVEIDGSQERAIENERNNTQPPNIRTDEEEQELLHSISVSKSAIPTKHARSLSNTVRSSKRIRKATRRFEG